MLRRFRKLVTRHAFLVALLSASPALAQQAPPRAATLLAPRPLGPGETPPLARAAMDDLPPLATTPVNRPTNPPPRPTGPAWLYDTNVQPAGGQVPARQPARAQPATDPYAPTPTRDQPSALSKGLDRIKNFGAKAEPAGREQPTATTPFRGTGANGAPVYAGPPAWRWYGYGTVTPGMNPLAPTGQYPQASANWYAITSATPGAVPIPVMNPARPGLGSDPPGYFVDPLARTPRQPLPQTYSQPVPQFPAGSYPPTGGGSKFGPVGETVERSKFEPTAAVGDAPKLLPQTPLPGAPSVPPATIPSTPVGVPTLTPPPAVSRPNIPPAEPAADLLPAKPAEPVVALPTIPIVPSEPVGVGPQALADAAVSGTPLTATKPADPPPAASPAPTADIQWQSTPQKLVPLETWGPATGTPQTPTPQPQSDRGWQPGASLSPSPSAARGQAPEANPQPNPVTDLIQAMCRGRVKDLDIRWTGSKRLTVCFEVRTEPEANRMVKDICARPELRPYAIDFCVLVK
jgi:hypothetical protein